MKDYYRKLEEFQCYFLEIHPEFEQSLQRLAPEFTPKELQMLSFVKIGMGTKEIAHLLHIQHNSVKVAKHRLKKKLFPHAEVSVSWEKLLEEF